ncbi:hypothetical protein BDW74DRAFT_174562 [Aspergillus multicolor]|uniref:uncharacterized protein n=1 Tax=Aspergillus multicolor TaxID=41759 RepID=UPI003CCE3A6B
MERSASRSRSATYGRACASCVKTKCRCIPRLEGNGCERSGKENSEARRIARLEGTIGELVELLQARNGKLHEVQVGNNDGYSVNHQEEVREDPQPPQREAAGAGGIVEDLGLTTGADAITADVITPAPSWPLDTSNHDVPFAMQTPPLMLPSASSLVARTSLETFRSRMLHHFPFAHFPDHLTANDLRRERPFLLRAICCVTSTTGEERRASSLEVKRLLHEAIFLHQSDEQQLAPQTVDLLLGLMVYIAWGWEHLHSRHNLRRLTAVVISLATELCHVNESLPDINRTISRLEPSIATDDVNGDSGTSDTASYLERQRAILGCFMLGSAVAAYYPEVDAPRWTPQMDKSLEAIVANGNDPNAKCPSDAALVIQVRLQLLATKAAQVRKRARLPDELEPEVLSSQSLVYIKKLMGQLQELRASIPPVFQQQFAILAQTYYTEMRILETIYSQQIIRGFRAKPSPPTCGPTRASCVWQMSLAIKSCTSTFLTISPASLAGISFVQWAQLVRSVATLPQASSPQESSWDLASSCGRGLIDLPLLLSSLADKLEQAEAEVGEQLSLADGAFSQLARGLRKFRSVYVDQREGSPRDDEQQKAFNSKPVSGGESNIDLTVGTDGYIDPSGQLLSPMSWLDQFFDFGDQMI